MATLKGALERYFELDKQRKEMLEEASELQKQQKELEEQFIEHLAALPRVKQYINLDPRFFEDNRPRRMTLEYGEQKVPLNRETLFDYAEEYFGKQNQPASTSAQVRADHLVQSVEELRDRNVQRIPKLHIRLSGV